MKAGRTIRPLVVGPVDLRVRNLLPLVIQAQRLAFQWIVQTACSGSAGLRYCSRLMMSMVAWLNWSFSVSYTMPVHRHILRWFSIRMP